MLINMLEWRCTGNFIFTQTHFYFLVAHTSNSDSFNVLWVAILFLFGITFGGILRDFLNVTRHA